MIRHCSDGSGKEAHRDRHRQRPRQTATATYDETPSAPSGSTHRRVTLGVHRRRMSCMPWQGTAAVSPPTDCQPISLCVHSVYKKGDTQKSIVSSTGTAGLGRHARAPACLHAPPHSGRAPRRRPTLQQSAWGATEWAVGCTMVHPWVCMCWPGRFETCIGSTFKRESERHQQGP